MTIGIEGSGSVTRIDDIRVATDWESAVGVPEPSTLLLSTLGLLSLIGFGRQRKR